MSQCSKRILVAEDNPALGAVLKFNLVRAGFDVMVTRSGTDAWAKFQENDFDIVVTDHQMPGMSGVEFVEKIRDFEGHEKLPVIMLTAKTLELDLERIKYNLGVVSIIPKPFSPSHVVSQVELALSSTVT